MGMTIDELKCIIGEYKLRIPPTVYYELLADLEDAEFIPKADYENRLKADMVAMLTELKKEIEEQSRIPNDNMSAYDWNNGVYACYKVVQQKIDALKDN